MALDFNQKIKQFSLLGRNCYWAYLKCTVSVISSDPPCKDDNARFTKVPLKDLSNQVRFIYQCL